MQVWINGEQRDLVDGARVADALAVLGAPSSGVAVAVDGEVVPRGEWAAVMLERGQRVEVLHAVQGG